MKTLQWLALALPAVACLLLWFWPWLPLPVTASSVNCTLPTTVALRVACSDDCGLFNSRALHSAARQLGYRISIIPSLRQQSDWRLDQLDALIIPGGADIDPDYYIPGLPPTLQSNLQDLRHLSVPSLEGQQRDEFEWQLLQRYFADPAFKQLPILGICRGMQMLSVSQSIPLYIDINTQLGLATSKFHIDRIAPGPAPSVIRSLAPDPFLAIQLHHQAMDLEYFRAHRKQFSDLEVTALSHDGRIPEVLEFIKRPILGTQFHPEYTPGAIRGQIFNWLLGRACEKRRAELVD